MYKSLLISIITATIFLSGCVSVPTASKKKDAELKTFAAPLNDASGIYIFRDTSISQGFKKNIYVDGVLIGESANKVYFYVKAAPGNHRLSAESERSDNVLELTTEPGKNYFVEQYIKLGAIDGGAALRLVSEEEGKKKVLKSKLAQPAQ